MSEPSIKSVVEGVLLAAGQPLSLDQILKTFAENERPERAELREAIAALQADYDGRAMELVEVGSGYRIQVRQAMEPWVSRLTEEKPARYSRALLETLALVAYRQPITRGEIEDIRGVSVSSSIMKTLQERDWIRVVGHRDVPGRPAMYATTRQFLDYFNLKGLDDLPSLMELRDFDAINAELELDLADANEVRPDEHNETGEAADVEDADDAVSVPETLVEPANASNTVH
jgi:segregation and condensation protein B